MTDDQQFILALATLILPTIGSLFAYRQSRSTHTAVNGAVSKLNRRARAQGRAQGRADVVVGNIPTTMSGKPLVDDKP